jgi:hypothetical protein
MQQEQSSGMSLLHRYEHAPLSPGPGPLNPELPESERGTAEPHRVTSHLAFIAAYCTFTRRTRLLSALSTVKRKWRRATALALFAGCGR